MLRWLGNSLAFLGFVFLLPILGFMAWAAGSPDEKWLMRVAACALGPFCLDFWYLVVTHIVLRRNSSYIVRLLIFVMGYAGIIFLLRSGMVRF